MRRASAGAACFLAAALLACGGQDGERRAEAPSAAERPISPAERSAAADSGIAARQAEVARRGPLVMPFDLERTTHVFVPTGEGGVQSVVADDPADVEQIGLVREHVREEARRFAAGDFADPAHIHGEAMPGLAELREGWARIEIRYEEIPDGARIGYVAAEPALVGAIHAWFAAQTSDHGAHARP